MTRTLRQRQRHTRRQKGGGIFDFINREVNLGDFFSRMNSRMNPFAPKTITEKFKASVKKVTSAAAAAPQNIVNKIPGVAPKRGGTRKRKQRKQRKN